MKEENDRDAQIEDSDEMRAEYNFSEAVRGRFYRPLHKGYTVVVEKTDGTNVVQDVKLEDGVVLLEPDVREYFPDSQAVNRALRSLIKLLEEVPGKQSLAGRPQNVKTKQGRAK
jgi:hypothetical protein